MSWLRQVRALPLNPALNDILKVEYLDVNLNNSRKLMANVASLGVEAKQLTQHEEDTVEAMLQLKNLRNELSWTDSLEADQVTEVLREAYRLQVYVSSEDVSSKNVG
ncbi:hypothetical protein C7M61_003762 [Candidozyma pseudohaemuli]|uniref:Uncharacterized protein n=1 Tax=Candidozyma pseudohaemuli TaxID=418784 RepID=A0A2P7YLN9_9ASCO|nr:hypothetical protein C7M61_003762 [[Candida] pseudohaemulonii]PSK36898.1 hypothetical protein C7M61_003762 [[Candida] pseudohaemulonii]